MAADIRPFTIDVSQDILDDLVQRLDQVRWPEKETVADRTQGVQLGEMMALADHWRTAYDWRVVEARMNAMPQFMTEIDGMDIHFFHVRSRHEDAMPLLLMHGWPGTVVELLKVIDPLTNPTAHGGRAEDAFHLVVPSMPGYGFSEKPTATGWDLERTGRAWIVLMERLGYDRYAAQGGDWGAGIAHLLGHWAPAGLLGVHVNFPIVLPIHPPEQPDEEEQAAFAAMKVFFGQEGGYFHEQQTKPQTIGYALADSPVAQAAWIYEKFESWTDSGGKPQTVMTMDEMLDIITMHWVTNSGASSARSYFENVTNGFATIKIDVPMAATLFPKEHYLPPRKWAEDVYSRLIYWNRAERGGHLPAFEQPEIFTREVRAAFASLRP